MKTLVDLTYIQPGRMYKSLSIYAFRFLDSLSTEEKKNFVLLVVASMEKELRERLPEFDIVVYDPYTSTEGGNRFVRLIRRMRIYRDTVDQQRCDCLFVPNDLVSFSCVKTKTRKVTVVHDMKSLKGARTLRDKLIHIITRKVYRHLLDTSDKVVAISKYTREDILRILGAKYANKIAVVYNSVTLPEHSVAPNIQLPEKYVLYVNSLLPYKNIKTMLSAFSLFHKTKNHTSLIVVGASGDYWRDEMVPFIRELGIENYIIQLQNLREEELKYLYEHACLFVTPSLHEGFGYTPIEAALCCCPVVSSKSEALPDTTMRLLNYYEPAESNEALAKAMLSVVDNPPTQEDLRKISEIYKQKYAPQYFKKQMLKIIENQKRYV